MGITRRQFIVGGTGLAALLGAPALWLNRKRQQAVTGGIVGASSALGHKLREGFAFPAPSETLRTKAVIIGGGIAGLSAAWKLHQSGFADFLLLELEQQAGGNSGYGENAVSAYPWGAHYVPLLTEESTTARELFEDLGIITGHEDGKPVYNEYYISADPHERLFIHGRWQEGLVPQVALTSRDREQYQSFFATMESFREKRGSDGRRAFAIPVDKSSADPEWRALDRISMADYMREQGWDSAYLKWYVDYSCRDDYGATAEQVSAWAGIHYFAGRSGQAANTDAQSVITWPEGNGWIVKQLKARFEEQLHTNALVFRVTPQGKGAHVHYWSPATNKVTEVVAESVILATPRFVAERLLNTGLDTSTLEYSPWVVANVTVDAMPRGKGAPLSWDNMIYNSKLLGYVVATHQNLNRIQSQTVLTYYWPLSHLPPKEARQWMLAQRYEQWQAMILKELLQVHPELEGYVRHLDIWLWGHGMIRPDPGFLWGAARQQMLVAKAPLFYAHSDMSGISIFEEANHRGVQAAQAVMKHLGHAFRVSS